MTELRRVAALYDIHGNLPALQAVLAEVRQADVEAVVVGGDVVPGPMPLETLACLLDLDLPTHFIRGNGDRTVAAVMAGEEPSGVPAQFREAMRWNAEQLLPEHRELLAGWAPTDRITVAEIGDVLFCHATPRNDTEIFTRRTPEERLLPVFGQLDVSLVVCGHTHMQFDRTVGDVRVVNAGSVGMPFEAPGAYWLLLGPDVQLRRTAYDLEAAAALVRSSAFPGAEEFASGNILRPPAEEQILSSFARVELQ